GAGRAGRGTARRLLHPGAVAAVLRRAVRTPARWPWQRAAAAVAAPPAVRARSRQQWHLVSSLAAAGAGAACLAGRPVAGLGARARLPVVRPARRDPRGGGARPARRAGGGGGQLPAALQPGTTAAGPVGRAVLAVARRIAGLVVCQLATADRAAGVGADHLRAAR